MYVFQKLLFFCECYYTLNYDVIMNIIVAGAKNAGGCAKKVSLLALVVQKLIKLYGIRN